MSVFRFFALLAVIVAVSACGKPPKPDLNKGAYWQRSDTTSALYLRGPKAQQILNRDVSRCVVEIRELERLGSIREAMPGDRPGNRVPPADLTQRRMHDWETPERDGYMYAEHAEYHDFETCMRAKGWSRTQHVPHDVADRARRVYTETIFGQRYQSTTGYRHERQQPRRDQGDYERLNP